MSVNPGITSSYNAHTGHGVRPYNALMALLVCSSPKAHKSSMATPVDQPVLVFPVRRQMEVIEKVWEGKEGSRHELYNASYSSVVSL